MTIAEYLRAHPDLSDADAAAALSEPIKTPKTDFVTLRSLGGVWGLSRAVAFRAWLGVRARGDDADLAGFASTILALLDGPGFDPGHADVPAAVAQLVTLSACTQGEADAVIYTVSLPTGSIVNEADVTAARAAIVRDARGEQIRAALGRASLAAAERVAAFERGEAAEPTANELMALFTVEM